jgi:hypothetical protein
MEKKKLGLVGLVLLSSLNLTNPIYSQESNQEYRSCTPCEIQRERNSQDNEPFWPKIVLISVIVSGVYYLITKNKN